MALVDPELTPESIRTSMAIPSTPGLRGLKDGVGFATTPEAMAAVVAASAGAPAGSATSGTVVGAICPHDDFLYAGRVYRAALAAITAKTVVIVGTFHRFRKFAPAGATFDGRAAWFAPDGPVPVSPISPALRARLGADAEVDEAAHDLEHSIEPIVAWLRHRTPSLEIVPLLPHGLPFDALWNAGWSVGYALSSELLARGLEPGRDVQVVISADAIHYGPDFRQVRYGLGADAAERAIAEDRRILSELLAGEIAGDRARELHDAFVDPSAEDGYRWTWCGRFAIPYGIALLHGLHHVEGGRLYGSPLAYATSLEPPLPVDFPPLGFTAPASYDHFVGYPAVAFTFAPPAST